MVLIRSSLGGCGRSPRSSYCSAMNLTSSSPRFCGLLPYLNYRSEIASTTPSPEVVWPTSLQQLSCASFFNRPIDGVVWPACSRARVRWWFRSAHHRGCVARLSPGNDFNQPIDEVVWPTSLQRYHSGRGSTRPSSQLFGRRVGRPATYADMPPDSFNQPIDEVVWPASLEQFSFGENFDEPIAGRPPCSSHV